MSTKIRLLLGLFCLIKILENIWTDDRADDFFVIVSLKINKKKFFYLLPLFSVCRYVVFGKVQPNMIPNGPRHENTCLWRFTNNTGADQPAHSRSLISAVVIRFLENTMLTCFTWNLNFQASLCSWVDWFETCFVGNPEDRFSRVEAQIIYERYHWSVVLLTNILF